MLSEVIFQTGQTNPFVVLIAVVGIVVVTGLAVVYKAVFFRSFGSDSESRLPEAKTNCPACGSRIPIDRENCDYCGESVAEGS